MRRLAILSGLLGVLVVQGCGSSGSSSSSSAPPPSTPATPAAPAAPAAATSSLTIHADPSGQLRYLESQARARAGSVTVKFQNNSQTPHNVVIAQGSTTIGSTSTVSATTASATVKLAAGTYTFYCSVDGHRAAGMQGTLTVS